LFDLAIDLEEEKIGSKQGEIDPQFFNIKKYGFFGV